MPAKLASYIKGTADDAASIVYCVNARKHGGVMEGMRIMPLHCRRYY